MCRTSALSVAMVLLASQSPYAAGAPGSCPRPADHDGPRYQIVTGAYQSRQKTPGGGTVVTIKVDRASPISVPVTGAVFSVAANLQPGTRVTLVSYVGDSMSGAMRPYSCIELAS
ncbi:MAG TPA: hypothetical protein VIE66_15555 [Methylocella sp.]